MAQAPGVNINISAAATAPVNATSTSNWFVAGVAAGPAGIVVPIKSMSDFATYFGQIINGQVTGRYTLNQYVDSTLLYDSLDNFFREGGSAAYVSRVQPTSTGVVATSGTSGGKFLLTASGKGTWANSSGSNASGLILSITGSTVNSTTVYAVSLAYNGNVLATKQGLGSETDVVNWINTLPNYQSMCTAALQSGTTVLPASGSSVSVYFTGGTDVAVADADAAVALAVFDPSWGAGQVSYPGNTSPTVYAALVAHAQANSRVAFLDAANTSNDATLEATAAALQIAVSDPSYYGAFAPWVIVPGIANSNPNTPTNVVFSRTVPPCSSAAALVAQVDSNNDANQPAAGVANGTLVYATGLSQKYTTTQLAALHAAGINVFKVVPNVNTIALYDFVSGAFDPAWASLANVRFRMQITRDLDIIGEAFMFEEIDGKGHLAAAFGGALSGQLLQYYKRGSLFGLTAEDAFSITTGSPVNTPTTAAAGQLNAVVRLRMSSYASFVTINITKYAPNASLPAAS